MEKKASAKKQIPAKKIVTPAGKVARNRGFKEVVAGDRKRLMVFSGCSLLFLILALVIGVNFVLIRDVLVGIRYQPSSEMAAIRTSLELTDKGVRIFNASFPELLEKTDFNKKCREASNETAILGCYTDDRVYIYNIVDKELSGIRELATAHELLHAVYKRMSDSDKNALVEPLTRVFEANQDLLGSEIDSYPVSEKQEELYVRAGTEIKDLPFELERHFAEVFSDQDKIVDFYNSYIGTFLKIKSRLSELLTEINNLESEINAKMSAYETGVSALNKKIREFNACAETLNCFTSTAEFNRQRAAIVAEQGRLKAIYEEANELNSRRTALVSEYNENILHGQALNIKINSSENVEVVGD